MSNLKVNTINDASGGSAAVLYGVASPPNSMGNRNRIINGDMRIDQRNAGASVTPTILGQYTLDRWSAYITQTSKLAIQQGTNATPSSGFSNFLVIASLSSYPVLSTDGFALQQRIEGFNCSDFSFGNAQARTITLSFIVNCSLTGTFGGSIYNSAANRFYPFSYSIPVANAATQISVVIPGDTTGTWLTTNGVGMVVSFGLGAGSTLSAAAGAWTTSPAITCTGATSVVGTNGATFYITGVQLEAGTVASPFERRDYGRELMMCQRYYTRFLSEASYSTFGIGTAYNTTTVRIALQPPVRMRAKPTSLDASAGSTFLTEYGSAGLVASAVALSGNDSSTMLSVQFTVSGATAGASYAVYANGTTNAYLGFGAEL